MRLTVLIQSHSAHAVEDPESLADAALHDVAAAIREGHQGGTINDANGNRVGNWALEIDEAQ